MTTNLLFSLTVTLVTNTVVTDNHQGCQTCKEINEHYYALYHTPTPECSVPWREATDKTETTTVDEKRTAVSGDIVFTDLRRVSEISRYYKLKKEWVLSFSATPNTVVTTNASTPFCAVRTNVIITVKEP